MATHIYTRIQSKGVACIYDEPGPIPAVLHLCLKRYSILTRRGFLLNVLTSKVPAVRHGKGSVNRAGEGRRGLHGEEDEVS